MALALLAMVNFVNFVDGIDEITVAHATPGIAACILAALAAELDGRTGLFAASLFGAMIGFWLWNRHPARIFLGDAGSLPLGLALGWFGLMLAERSPAAGVLILVYPLSDAAWTLARRLVRGDRVTMPHREHAYQAATDTGLPHRRIIITVTMIAGLGAILALACLTLLPMAPCSSARRSWSCHMDAYAHLAAAQADGAMTVLVTGANGFVGRAIVRHLADQGRAVRAASRNPDLLEKHPNATAVLVPDLSELLDWRDLVAGVHAIVHTAGLAHQPPGRISAGSCASMPMPAAGSRKRRRQPARNASC